MVVEDMRHILIDEFHFIGSKQYFDEVLRSLQRQPYIIHSSSLAWLMDICGQIISVLEGL